MQLGRYQILKQLATGDVANVHLARASGLEGFARHVVLKAIRPELAQEERLVESFLEEARIAAALHHQNIVQVHDIGEQDGSYFFAMEYVHGEDVRKLLAKVRELGEQVPIEHVVAIVTSTAAALHHAHEQRNPSGEPLGLVHRDVCPANILLGYDGSVKLVDFGMAKAALRSVKTASGSLRGKAAYMSPEQCVGRTVDRRTDTFALGIVLYELLTARRLYKGANEYLTMAAIVEGDVPPPSTARPNLPKELDEVALRALARAPEARYQSAEDLREALERFAIEHALRTSNKSLADYMIALFGQRPEPWHTDVEPSVPSAVFDIANDSGVVAAPASEADLLAREAPRSTAPIMLAQSLSVADEVDGGWDDPEEPSTKTQPEPGAGAPAAGMRPSQQIAAATAPTRTPSQPMAAVTPVTRTPSQPMAAVPKRTPSQPMAAVTPSRASQPMVPVVRITDEEPRNTDEEETRNERPPPTASEAPPPPAVDDDLYGATVVAPPLFVDEESSVQREDSVTTPPVFPDGDEDETLDLDHPAGRATSDADPLAADLHALAALRALQPPLPEMPPGTEAPALMPPPARSTSEMMYVGPPAPPANRIEAAQTFLATYRPIVIGAGAGLVALVVGLLAMRACG